MLNKVPYWLSLQCYCIHVYLNMSVGKCHFTHTFEGTYQSSVHWVLQNTQLEYQKYTYYGEDLWDRSIELVITMPWVSYTKVNVKMLNIMIKCYVIFEKIDKSKIAISVLDLPFLKAWPVNSHWKSKYSKIIFVRQPITKENNANKRQNQMLDYLYFCS